MTATTRSFSVGMFALTAGVAAFFGAGSVPPPVTLPFAAVPAIPKLFTIVLGAGVNAPPTAEPIPWAIPPTAEPIPVTVAEARPKRPSMPSPTTSTPSLGNIPPSPGFPTFPITFFYSLFLVSALQDEPSTNQHKDLFHKVSNFQSQISNICDAEPKQRSYYSSFEASCDSAPHKKIFEIR